MSSMTYFIQHCRSSSKKSAKIESVLSFSDKGMKTAAKRMKALGRRMMLEQ
jgi:hypothetical protein